LKKRTKKPSSLARITKMAHLRRPPTAIYKGFLLLFFKKAVLLLCFAAVPALADERAHWQAEAAAVTIVRDDWGIAHIHASTDADAVFGMIYAQAEDDFNRVETNYLTALGRMAEAEGTSRIYQDLRQRLFIDPAVLKADYASSPDWLKALMNAWADGLNFFLATHPKIAPRVITHFEPWMALSFSEGSIGGDIERVNLSDLEAFYGHKPVRHAAIDTAFKEPDGSNGIAIAPANTVDHHALLLINPHTSFFFRSEQQVTSDEGLNAYGAATWGQFFIYQGFNAHAGWMHTSSGVDNVDRFAETIVTQGGQPFYRYGTQLRPVTVGAVTLAYKSARGMATQDFTVYHTHHGPVIGASGDKWMSLSLMNTPVAALEQSFLRTKATDYASFMKIAALKANSSNNTIFADDHGDIAYLHPQFIPRRDDKFDYTKPVDGADPATGWKGLHALSAAPHVLNPPVGWVFNTNDWPYSAAGPDSPRRQDYPRYMDTVGENPRGLHATRLLQGRHDFTPFSLMISAYDSYLPAFARLIPTLAAAYDNLPAGDPLRGKLADQVAALRAWDDHWAVNSIETSLAVFWGEALWAKAAQDPDEDGMPIYQRMAGHTTGADKLLALDQATSRLRHDFGDWRVPWGEINRFQRLNDDIAPAFTDEGASIPVPFTSSQWGSLASFGAKRYPGTKRYYGTKGNSFVAVVQFGPHVHAWAVTAGGESGDPKSKHFDDEAIRYAQGNLREVYFYPEALSTHTERTYRPGQ
jgi:acyl-homoserine-lactone acylase